MILLYISFVKVGLDKREEKVLMTGFPIDIPLYRSFRYAKKQNSAMQKL